MLNLYSSSWLRIRCTSSNRPILLDLLSVSNQGKTLTFTKRCYFSSKSLSAQTWATKVRWILRKLTISQDEISDQINVKTQCRKSKIVKQHFINFPVWGKFSRGFQMNQEFSICSAVLNNKYLFPLSFIFSFGFGLGFFFSPSSWDNSFMVYKPHMLSSSNVQIPLQHITALSNW